MLLPERVDWIAQDNPVRAVDAFVDELYDPGAVPHAPERVRPSTANATDSIALVGQ